MRRNCKWSSSVFQTPRTDSGSDETGKEFSELPTTRAQKGIKVRVMVDGQHRKSITIDSGETAQKVTTIFEADIAISPNAGADAAETLFKDQL